MSQQNNNSNIALRSNENMFTDKEDAAAEIKELKEKLLTKEIQLYRLQSERDDEIHELNKVKAQLEEAKSILEIRVKAKTRELRELTENLEKQISARTRELQEKIKESEDSRLALMNMLEDMEDLRRRAQEEKEKTLAIITNFADGLLFFDANNCLALVNPQIESYFGVAKEDIQQAVGKNFAELGQIGGLQPLVSLMGSLKKITRKELTLNEKTVLEISSLEIGRPNDKIGWLVIIHDISREKTIERMKTEFVSIAAHQLRTPISAIKWTLRMILDGDLGPISDEQRDFLEKTYKSNERMIGLINDLLNVTRIEEGRLLFDLVPVDLGETIQSLLGAYAEILKQKSIKLQFTKPKEKLPQVMVDIEKIMLVVSNLLENAIKYTPAGGKIFLEISSNGKGIEVSVRDTGIGIMKSQQDRIFTKYFRGSNAMHTETEGTGLGLFIAKNIVETHGGKIWFSSQEGSGTTFYFSLPAAGDSALQQKE